MLRKWLTLLAVVVASLGAAVSAARADGPVVRAVLFYSPSCPHCHQVIAQDLPPLMDTYGDQLEIAGIDTTHPTGGALYEAAVQRFEIPPERLGVPMLIVGESVMVGSSEIPAQFPALIESYLAEGGQDWPDIPGLADLIAEANASADSEQAPAEAAADEPAAAASTDLDAAEAAVTGFRPLERFRQDRAGNTLAVMVLGGIVAGVVAVGVRGRRVYRQGTGAAHRANWWIPLLAVIGLGVAGYLAYVETTRSSAVCGPVGDCNTVQQSDYAWLFGVLPIGVLGVAGYGLILAAWLLGQTRSHTVRRLSRLALFGFTAAGTLFSLYLTFLEPFVIGATCMWCLTSAVIMAALLALTAPPGLAALRALRRQPQQRQPI